jgi:hypothetical protein
MGTIYKYIKHLYTILCIRVAYTSRIEIYIPRDHAVYRMTYEILKIRA